MSMAPGAVAAKLASGLLSFPVTPFDDRGRFSESDFRAHCAFLLDYQIGGLFPAGGAGEIFSLSPEEAEMVVRAAVDETAGRVPVIAGVGYSTVIAIGMAKAAEKAGADGILLLPPYLVNASQRGLAAHVEAVCKATALPVIVYNRDNCRLDDESLAYLCDRNSNLIGLKDGIGDIELLMQIYARLGNRLIYINGLPTAETFALPYFAMVQATYSSAIFNFMPEWALDFHLSVRAMDRVAVMRGLNEFVMPYVKLRNANRGYAVAIGKAGVRIAGRPAGAVRTPLTDLTGEEFQQLAALMDRAGRALADRRHA